MKIVEWTLHTLLTVPVVIGVIIFILPLCGISVDVVLSGSMEPEIKTGGIVFTNTKEKNIQIGDILTYRLNEQHVTHRVLAKRAEGLITKGDANRLIDAAPVQESQIIGKVVGDLPYLGYVICFLKRKAVFCLLMAALFQELMICILDMKGERSRILRRK